MSAALQVQSQMDLLRRQNTAPPRRQGVNEVRKQVNDRRQSRNCKHNETSQNTPPHGYSFASFAIVFSPVSTAEICGRLTRIRTLGAISRVTMLSVRAVTLP